MKHFKTGVAFTILVLFAASWLSAEGSAPLKGFILKTNGSGFSIYRQGVFSTHSDNASFTGFPLYAGDMIYTNSDSNMEIQILPGSGTLCAGENTSFQLPSEKAGIQEIKLLYGRLKFRSTESAESGVVVIHSSVLALPREGSDFCIDQFIDGKGNRRNEVNVLDGQVVLINPDDYPAWTAAPADASARNSIASYVLQSHKGVNIPVTEPKNAGKNTVTSNLNGIFVETKDESSADLIEYWGPRSTFALRLSTPDQKPLLAQIQTWPKNEDEVQTVTKMILGYLYKNVQAETVASSQKKDEIPVPAAKDLPRRLADDIEPLKYLEPAALITNPVHVLEPDAGKTAGIWLGLTGVLLDVSAVLIEKFLSPLLGLPQADCTTAAIITGSVGGAAFGTGIIIYLDALFN